MKKKFLAILGLCTISLFAVVASGCGIKDKLDKTMEQMQCVHEWNAGEITRESTCVEKGERVKTCVLCQATKTENLALVAHTDMQVQSQLPTCEKSGLSNGSKCSVCGKAIVEQQVLPAKGHTVVVDKEIPAQCEQPGKTEGAHCSVCNKVLLAQESIPAIGHEMAQLTAYEPTCEKTGYTGGEKCERCDKTTTGEIIPALGHTWDSGRITREATCIREAVKTYTCQTCSGTREETLGLGEHSYENGVCKHCGKTQYDHIIEGKWVFSDNLKGDVEFFQPVNYTINGIAYQSIAWKYKEKTDSWYVGGGDSQTLNDVLYQQVDPAEEGNDGWIAGGQTIIFDSAQGVSKEFYDWMQENARRIGVSYELRGTWKFKDQITTTDDDVFYEVIDFALGDDWFYVIYTAGPTTLWASTIDLSIGTEGYLCIYSTETGWCSSAYQTIRFDGTVKVTETFYNWFIANTEEQVQTFTIDGKTYQALSGMTWERWCNSSYNTDGYFYTNVGDESFIYRADSNVNGKYYYVSGGSGFVSPTMSIFGAGNSLEYRINTGQAGSHGGGSN